MKESVVYSNLFFTAASGAIGHACNSPTFCLEQQDDNPFVGEQDQDVSSDGMCISHFQTISIMSAN